MVLRSSICGSLRLNQPCIFLPSAHRAEEKPAISGVLCLSVASNTAVRSISVHVKGQTELPFEEGILSSTSHEEIIFERSQTLAGSKEIGSFVLPAGRYEFPFEIPLDPVMHDTITGPEHSYHFYQVYGVVQRRYYRNDVVSQPLRVYRPTVTEPSDISFSDSITTEDLSDPTVPYSVSIPHKTIPFGSTFPVHFWMAPLDKGLRMKAINIAVVEKHAIKIAAPAAYATRYGVRHLTSARTHTIFTEEHAEREADYLAPASEMFDIEWSTTKAVALPKSLDACTQRVKLNHIQIYHELEFTIELLNAKRDLSVIRGTLPFNVVILPHSVMADGTVRGFELEQFLHDNDSPPPLYGAHLVDPLLCDNLKDVGPSTGDPSSLTATSDLPCAPCYDQVFGCLPDPDVITPARIISG